jgi:hypothetical protein
MPPVFSRESIRDHWIGFLFLLPGPVLGMLYDARRLSERIPSLSAPDGRAYDYHMTPLTVLLGSVLPWVFLLGMATFLIHAAWQRRKGAKWFWGKLLFLPVYWVGIFILLCHTD